MSQLNRIRRLQQRSTHATGPSRWIIGLLLAVALLLVAAAAYALSGSGGNPAAVEVSGAPRLRVDRELVDLGDIPLGRTVQVDFRLTNVGDQPLRFTETPYIEVVEGCCPPDPTIGSLVLQPGQSTTLSMSFMMHEGMGGKHNFRVHIANNDPAGSLQSLTVLSNCVQ